MCNPPARLWVSQMDSDRLAARRVYDDGDHRTYCQAIAKHQQTVEKSVKAIAAALCEAGILRGDHSEHYYAHDVATLISVIQRLPSPKGKRREQLLDLVCRLLGAYNASQIQVLSDLAPKGRPPAAQLHQRNTEYPYETALGVWTAPALPDTFTTTEVQRFSELAERIYEGARQIVSAARRLPAP